MAAPGAGAAAGWFDSHCHLQDEYLDAPDAGPGPGPDQAGTPDRPGVVSAALAGALGRARRAGVDQMVCVGTDPATSAQALALASASADGTLGPDAPAVFATVGLHPHEASAGTGPLPSMVEAARSAGAPLVAVGECGLDYHYEHSPRSDQRRAFAEQIALANAHRLALVIHAREAWDDLFEVLGSEGVPERTVLHCFTGGPDELTRCLDAGMWVSFSGIVTFKGAAGVREAALRCPLERLLVETDSPFLAPVPHRGRPNEPAYVAVVGAAIAALRGLDDVALADSTAGAAQAVFSL
ncbi:MAG: TatD family hydrolase [Acidimicrobiales bacterium]